MNDVDQSTLEYLQLLLDAGCRVKHITFLAGKRYAWMEDSTGVIFLEPLPSAE